MCEYCMGEHGKEINIKESPNSKETQPTTAQIVQLEGDSPGVIIYRNGIAQGFFDVNNCFMCGRKLNDKSETNKSLSDESEILFKGLLSLVPGFLKKENDIRKELLRKLWNNIDDYSKRNMLVSEGIREHLDVWEFDYKEDLKKLDINI